jgi:hypothetical protein
LSISWKEKQQGAFMEDQAPFLFAEEQFIPKEETENG